MFDVFFDLRFVHFCEEVFVVVVLIVVAREEFEGALGDFFGGEVETAEKEGARAEEAEDDDNESDFSRLIHIKIISYGSDLIARGICATRQ